MTNTNNFAIIDPIEALINFMKGKDLIQSYIGEQIADEYRFGNDWERPSAALVFGDDGGDPDLYLPNQNIRVEAKAYGKTYAEAQRVFGSVVKTIRDFYNAGANPTIETEAGKALIMQLTISTQPTRFDEPDVNVPCMLFFIDLVVSEIEVN